MWKPRRLTILRASAAYYRDSFTFTFTEREREREREREKREWGGRLVRETTFEAGEDNKNFLRF
jgi:hypothetical protein